VKNADPQPDGWFACPDGHAHRFVSGAARCLCGAFKSEQAGDRVYPTQMRAPPGALKYRDKPPHPKCVAANRQRWQASDPSTPVKTTKHDK